MCGLYTSGSCACWNRGTYGKASAGFGAWIELRTREECAGLRLDLAVRGEVKDLGISFITAS